MNEYLKPKLYYIDCYDLHTIKECLHYYWAIKDSFVKERQTKFIKYSDEKFNQEVNGCLNLLLHNLKGERYRGKAKTIQEWMDADRVVQEKYDTAIPPSGIRCKKCSASVKIVHKDLLDSSNPNARVMFMFECMKCKKRQALYEDGTEWKYDPPRCPKCNSSLKSSLKRKGDVLTTTYRCPKCSYKKTDIEDFQKSHKEFEEKEARDTELLMKYRKEFVFDEKEGEEYIELSEKMEVGREVFEEERRKYADPVFERSVQLKKITIVDLEKLLTPLLGQEQYVKLSFDKPEIGQYVIVPFSVQDASSRSKYESTSRLEKLLKKTLEDTNWRLMSDGVSYRLGYVSGKLKGYEQEEDMLELAGKKKEQKQAHIESEKRMKYAGDNYVQLQRFLGQQEGVEDARKRRLVKEPDGFFLNDGKTGYTCGICRKSQSGEQTWWDLRGIRCADCQRNLKAGIIPDEIFEDDYGYDVVIGDFEFRSDYGLNTPSVRKFRKEGLLIGRDLKRVDGTVYYTLYLVSENKEFLKKYSKKQKDITSVQETKK